MADNQENLKEIYSELLDEEKINLFVIPEIRLKNKTSDYLYLQYQKYFNDPQLIFHKPGSHLNYVWMQKKQKSTLIHHHWLDCQDGWDLISISFKLICLMIFKKLDGKIVWTIHNKKPLHSRYKWFNGYARSWMAKNADRLLVHCKSVIPEVSDFFQQPKSKFRVINHPEFPSKKLDREKGIRRLNKEYDLDLKENDRIFLMFGNINSQKRIVEVCSIFSSLQNDMRLIVAGPVKKGHLKYYRIIRGKFDKKLNISILPNFISEKNVSLFFNSADCVLFNYNEVLTSGGVELAKSYMRPIIAPKVGCLSELKGERISLFENQEELKELILHYES